MVTVGKKILVGRCGGGSDTGDVLGHSLHRDGRLKETRGPRRYSPIDLPCVTQRSFTPKMLCWWWWWWLKRELWRVGGVVGGLAGCFVSTSCGVHS